MTWVEKRRDEAKIEAPDAPGRTPGKKDTKHWCKGKVGVPHTIEVKIPDNAYHRVCREFSWRSLGTKRSTWSCQHQEVCTTCGKHLGRPKTCPDQP